MSFVRTAMLDVIIALLPATTCAVYFFGWRAAVLIGTCVASCVVCEVLCRLAMGRRITVGDWSAVLTGLLLALNLPPDLPLWKSSLMVSMVFSFAAAVGFGFALMLFSGLREKLDKANPPRCFRGMALALVTAGLLSLAFMGFSGLMKLPY